MADRHLVITYDHDIEHKFMKNNDFWKTLFNKIGFPKFWEV